MNARIKVGTTTWAGRGLVQAGWYPADVKSSEDRLHYYASQFPIVENEAGYYAVLTRTQVQTWADRAPRGFTMNMKAHALLTAHYADPRRLPKDLKVPRDKRRVYPKDLSAATLRAIEHRFVDALAPLHEAGKLGVVLFQFPDWFVHNREHRGELVRLRDAFAPYRIAVELRNKTWHDDRTIDFLRDEAITYTCVDRNDQTPIVAATTDLAVIRMHGRSPARFKRGRSLEEGARYLYSREELAEWVPRIESLRAREVHVLFNNAVADYAVRNARDLIELLPVRRRKRA